MLKESKTALTLATSLFEQAIALAPDYPSPHAGIGAAYVRLGHWLVLPPEQAFPKARTAALEALRLDDGTAEAHTALADVHFLYDWDWVEAEDSYQRAIRLNPSSAQTLRSYAGFLMSMKRFAESTLLTERAQQVDPASIYLNAFAAVQLYCARQYSESIQAAKKTLRMDSQCSTAHLFLGLSYLQTGRIDDAVEELGEAVTSVGVTSRIAHVAYAFAVSSRVTAAEKILNKLLEDSKSTYVSPWLIAIIYAGLHRNDQAFDCLEACYRRREHDLVFSNLWPQFDHLRPDPRWNELMFRINLPI